MIGLPTLKDFNIFFSDDFLMPEVRSEFSAIFKEYSMDMKMIDFINSTAVGTDMLGYDSPTTVEQSHHRGNTRTFEGSLHKNRRIDKKLSISFSLRSSILNYMMLYRNIEVFNEKKRTNDDLFYPPLFLFLVSPDGNILFVWEYREIQIPSLPQISLRKDDKGGNNKTFSLEIKYNEVIFHNKMPNIGQLSGVRDQYRHEFDD